MSINFIPMIQDVITEASTYPKTALAVGGVVGVAVLGAVILLEEKIAKFAIGFFGGVALGCVMLSENFGSAFSLLFSAQPDFKLSLIFAAVCGCIGGTISSRVL